MQRAEPPRRPGRMGGSSLAGSTVAYTGRGPAWLSESDRAVPAEVPCGRILIDTPDLVVFVTTLRVYRSSFSFTLSGLLRPDASVEAEDSFAQAFAHGFHQQISVEQAERTLRLGVRFADGRGAALNPNLRGLPHVAPQPDALPLMRTGRTSADSGTAEREVWVLGLPENGNVEFFYRWLEIGVAESSIEIDGDALRSASARAVILWEPPTGATPDPPSRPVGRGGG